MEITTWQLMHICKSTGSKAILIGQIREHKHASSHKSCAVRTLLCLGPAIAAEARLPSDVAKFVDQREGCDHFRGEFPDPPDEKRMREIEREIRKLCTGTDKKLQQLKRKYAKNQAILKRLNEFEENIEAPLRKGSS